MPDPTKLTPSKLRANVYRVLDQILDTGIPVEIERRGRRLRIVADAPVRSTYRRKLARLKRRPLLNCAPEALVHIDWSRKWRP